MYRKPFITQASGADDLPVGWTYRMTSEIPEFWGPYERAFDHLVEVLDQETSESSNLRHQRDTFQELVHQHGIRELTFSMAPHGTAFGLSNVTRVVDFVTETFVQKYGIKLWRGCDLSRTSELRKALTEFVRLAIQLNGCVRPEMDLESLAEKLVSRIDPIPRIVVSECESARRESSSSSETVVPPRQDRTLDPPKGSNHELSIITEQPGAWDMQSDRESALVYASFNQQKPMKSKDWPSDSKMYPLPQVCDFVIGEIGEDQLRMPVRCTKMFDDPVELNSHVERFHAGATLKVFSTWKDVDDAVNGSLPK